MTQQLDMLGMMLDERASSRLGLPKTREVRRPRMAPLVDVPRAATADPETSQFAAELIKASGALGKQQQHVLDQVRRTPGLTSAEIAEQLTVVLHRTWRDHRHMVARRLPELAVLHVKRGDARECRVTGSKSITWWPL